LAACFVTVVVLPLDPQADAAATAATASDIDTAFLNFMRNLSVVSNRCADCASDSRMPG
jgi:hypothetical protein